MEHQKPISKPETAAKTEGVVGVDVPRLVRCSCGSQCFERVTPIRGTWREYVVFNDDGTENADKSESTTDDLIHGNPPKTMKCAECGKRRSNPDAPNS